MIVRFARLTLRQASNNFNQGALFSRCARYYSPVKKFVEYTGGADSIIAKAQADYNKGQYRWVATALNYVVFADPDNSDAKELLAKNYDQMGYQAESGSWRTFYLSGVNELRDGVKKAATPNTGSPGMGNS